MTNVEAGSGDVDELDREIGRLTAELIKLRAAAAGARSAVNGLPEVMSFKRACEVLGVKSSNLRSLKGIPEPLDEAAQEPGSQQAVQFPNGPVYLARPIYLRAVERCEERLMRARRQRERIDAVPQ